MRHRFVPIFCLIPVLLAQSGNGMANSHGRTRGKKTGGYALTMAGDYNGTGTAAVTDASVSFSAILKFPDGSSGAVTFSNLPLVNDRFQGAIMYRGTSMKIYGRVDLPSAQDDQETAAQAVAGRVTATLQDGSGRMGRLIAIQDAASRGGNGNGNGNGNGGGNGGGGSA